MPRSVFRKSGLNKKHFCSETLLDLSVELSDWSEVYLCDSVLYRATKMHILFQPLRFNFTSSFFYAPLGCSTDASVEFQVEVPLLARRPTPAVGHSRTVEFGTVCDDKKAFGVATLMNKGSRKASFSVTWDKTLPLVFSPSEVRMSTL